MGGAITVRAGWIAQSEVPTAEQVEGFVSAWSVIASANGPSRLPAVGVTWGATGFDANDFSVEGGFTLLGKAGASLTGSYSFQMASTNLVWTI